MKTLKNSAVFIDRILFKEISDSVTQRALAILFLIALFIMGCGHWYFFYRSGAMEFEAYDWRKVELYLLTLQKAVNENQLPFHTNWEEWGTKRFLTIPSLTLSPQIYLLKFLNPQQYVWVNTLIFYSLGFWGGLLIKRKFHFSLFTFSLFFLLFNFNGYITSRLAVGHITWMAYFLLPPFALIILDYLEGNNIYQKAILCSLVLFLMLLQGAFHIFVWCHLFLLIFTLSNFNRRNFTFLITVSVLGALLGLFRFCTSALTFWSHEHSFISGYPSVRVFIDALTTIKNHSADRLGGALENYNLGWWEFDFFIGVIALAFIIYYGIYTRVISRSENQMPQYKELNIAILIMTVFSFSYFYLIISKLPLPLIDSERVTSRLLVIPFLFLLIFSCVQLQNKLSTYGIWPKVFAIIFLLQTCFELINHSYAWRLGQLEYDLSKGPVEQYYFLFPVEGIHLLSLSDPLYKGVFISLSILALFLFIALALIAIRHHFRKI